MKKILLLSTNADDARILLWCMREANYDCVVAGNLSQNRELEHFPLCHKLYAIPEQWSIEKRSPEIIPILGSIMAHEKTSILLPTGFESIKFLSQHYENVKKFGPVIPLPTLAMIDTLSNKFSFAKFCKENDIPHPDIYLLEDLAVVRDKKLPIRFPLLTKPLSMSAGKGIYVFHNGDELYKYLQEGRSDLSNALPLLLQEFIPGQDIDFNGFAQDGRLCAWTIQKAIEIPRGDKEPLRWIQFLPNDEVKNIGERIIEKSGYSGPIHIDMRVDERNGQVKSIEINPRFWASTFYSICDGVNFPAIAVQCTWDRQYTATPNNSHRIWGTPHRIPLLFLQYKDLIFLKYGLQHTWLQVKFEILNRYFNFIQNYNQKNKNGHKSNIAALANTIK